MKKLSLFTIVLFFLGKATFSQDQLVSYHGQLRTLLSDERLAGNVLNGDSLSAKRGAYGTIFLDLGIAVKPSEDFQIYSELRLRNLIGQNDNNTNNNALANLTGNSLIDSRVVFRQIRAEGNIRKIVKYQIGDIDLGLTPFTLWGNNETYNDYESENFKRRREIISYENFQTNNTWRLQGASAKSQINFNRAIRKIDLHAFGTRTKMNTGDLVPDRLIAGGKLEITQSKYLTLGLNFVSMFDLPGTVFDSLNLANDYQNNVLSANYLISPYEKGGFALQIIGEHGISRNNYYLSSANETKSKADYFVHTGLKGMYKPAKIALEATYLNVGQDFTSPGAQTLRIRPFQTPMMFSQIENNTVARPLTVFDRTSDLTVYNQRIQTGLMRFNPVYGNVLPYGNATPNRKGLIYNFSREQDTTYVLSYSLGGALLSEIVSEGDVTNNRLRSFAQVKGGVKVNLSKILDYQKLISLSLGGRLEKTERSGVAFVDFQSLMADLGLSIEIFNGVHLQGGAKYIQYKGTEVFTNRDAFGTIYGYNFLIANGSENVLSSALKLDLSANSFASTEYNYFKLNNLDENSSNYSMRNLFINFTTRF